MIVAAVFAVTNAKIVLPPTMISVNGYLTAREGRATLRRSTILDNPLIKSHPLLREHNPRCLVT